jgi:hypothetical protein
MGGACSTYGREDIQDFWWGGDHFEDLDVDGMIIIKWVSRKWDGVGMDWIDLAENRDR